jgi:hypothetical protein
MIKLIKKILKLIFNLNSNLVIKDYDLEYMLWISSLYLKIKNIPGHIAEIGVADGRNAVLFGRLIKLYNEQSVRQYIGFDTFDGFTEKDLVNEAHLSKTRWKSNSKDAVLKRCKDNNIGELVEIFEGDAVEIVPNILLNHRGKKFLKGKAKFALLYIDCNAYAPALRSMENFLPYIVPGGFIVIDEKLQGSETQAIFDFAKKNLLKVERFGGNEVPMAIQIPQISPTHG